MEVIGELVESLPMKLATGLRVFSWRMRKRIRRWALSRISLQLPTPRSFHCSSRTRYNFTRILKTHSSCSVPVFTWTLGKSTCKNYIDWGSVPGPWSLRRRTARRAPFWLRKIKSRFRVQTLFKSILTINKQARKTECRPMSRPEPFPALGSRPSCRRTSSTRHSSP